MHPNTMTLYRVAASPILILLIYFPNRVTLLMAAFVFSAAAITDFLDGYLARRWNLVSTFGKMLDPLADKLLMSSAFIMMVYHQWVPAWIICLILGRELAVTGLRNLMADKGADISASVLGKYKTGFQIAAIIPLLIHYPYFGIRFHAIGNLVLWVALVFTLWSGADYFIRFSKMYGDNFFGVDTQSE
ncbi:MAG: CDP-diacylglycerol--glycerol-3-phosphate 3-phosphatidyltransferase [Deltaproteobacteria bacterium]|nr:MAG: CDP-diacylglycerol--glycerol-3-phosphate 3-phosphatidyltransferase [Deltaproteobacteria bacterium]